MRYLLAAAILVISLPAAAQTNSLSPGAGQAQHPPPSPAVMAARRAARQACAADVAKLCPDVANGGGKVMECVRQHVSDLSAPCAQALQSLRDARKAGQG